MRLILAILLASPAFGAWTFSQGRAGGNDSVTSVDSASASPSYAAGDLLVVRVGFRQACASITISVTDNGTGGTNTYTQIGSNVDNTTNTCQAMFRSVVARTATVVTASTGATSVRFISISVLHFTGPTTPTLDQSPSAGTGVSSEATTGSMTTTAAAEVFVSGLQVYGGDTFTNAPTDGSGNAITGCSWTKTASDPYGGMGTAWYCIASSTYSGTVKATVTAASIVTNQVVTFKDDVAAASSPRRRIIN